MVVFTTPYLKNAYYMLKGEKNMNNLYNNMYNNSNYRYNHSCYKQTNQYQNCCQTKMTTQMFLALIISNLSLSINIIEYFY